MEMQEHTPSFWDKIVPEMETNRFGTVSIIILIVGCLGGIIVSQGAGQSWIQLSVLIVPLMATLVMILAVMPMRLIMNATAVNLAIYIVMLLINLL
jgi:hypothetical protein